MIYINCDCMDGMARYPDRYFDLAVVDPPYYSGPEKRRYYGREISPIGVQRYYEPSPEWGVPGRDYFDELMRVSKHQIIWGCNYFDYPFGPGRIVWDKCNGGSSFSDCEIAYCSLHDSVRLYRYMWNGMMQGKDIHNGHIQLIEGGHIELLKEIASRLANYEQRLGYYDSLEEQGRLPKLPCAVGDTVYTILPNERHFRVARVNKIEIKPTVYGKMCYLIEPVSHRGRLLRYYESDLGRGFFTTQEEAEVALERMKENDKRR